MPTFLVFVIMKSEIHSSEIFYGRSRIRVVFLGCVTSLTKIYVRAAYVL